MKYSIILAGMLAFLASCGGSKTDEKTGWINEYMVATNAKVGVAIGDVSLYKNPDVMSVSSDKVAVADIIAISGDKKDGFRQVYGKEKKIKGFVNLFDKISSDPIDLKVA